MKEYLIKLLGGYTFLEYNTVKLNRRQLFRRGDSVFINDKRFDPRKKYFLLESYNLGSCWYVDTFMESEKRRELDNGVHIDHIQFDEIETCPCCNKPITQIPCKP